MFFIIKTKMGWKSRLHVSVFTAVLLLNGGCLTVQMILRAEKDLLDSKQGRPKLGYCHLSLSTDRKV